MWRQFVERWWIQWSWRSGTKFTHTHTHMQRCRGGEQLSIEAWNWHPSQMPFATWIWWLLWLDIGFIKVHLFHVSSNADACHFCLCAMCTSRNTASILFILYKIEWKLRAIITCITHLCNDYRCDTHTPRLVMAKVRIIVNDIIGGHTRRPKEYAIRRFRTTKCAPRSVRGGQNIVVPRCARHATHILHNYANGDARANRYKCVGAWAWAAINHSSLAMAIGNYYIFTIDIN